MTRKTTIMTGMLTLSSLTPTVSAVTGAEAYAGYRIVRDDVIPAIEWVFEEEAKGTAYANANGEEDDDSDSIRRITRVFGETDIDLSVDAKHQKAHAWGRVEYNVPNNTPANPLASLRAVTQAPDEGERNPQTAFIESKITAGKRTFHVERRSNSGGNQRAMGLVPINLPNVMVLDASDMNVIQGSGTLDVSLGELERTNDKVRIGVEFWDDRMNSNGLQFGYLDNAPLDMELIPNDDLSMPDGYEALADISFNKTSNDVWVQITDNTGTPYSDSEIYALAAEQLFGFDAGRDDAAFDIQFNVGSIEESVAQMSVEFQYSMPAALQSWIDEGRSFIAPDWTYYDSAIDSGAMSYADVWADAISSVESLGLDVHRGAFHSGLADGMGSSMATPTPGTLCLAGLSGLALARRQHR